MKKAKIFLTVLTVLAVVGGGLAFKVKSFNKFCRECDLVQKMCILNCFMTQATTNNAISPANYAPYGKPCSSNADCTTLTTFNP